MVRLTIALFLLQHSSTTCAFSLPAQTVTAEGRTSGSASASALFQYKPIGYDDPDAINMEQPGGVVPVKPVKPLKTVPSTISKIQRRSPASDDQSELNHHDVKTVPSAMSRIERGRGYSASDDQSENNHHDIKTVPSTMSRIERGPASDDQHDLNYHKVKTVPSAMSGIDRGGMGLIRSSDIIEDNGLITEKANDELQKEAEQTESESEESIQNENANTNALPMPVPVLTVPSSISRAAAASSDDQHDLNYHYVKTVPSAMSKKTKSLPLPYSD